MHFLPAGNDAVVTLMIAADKKPLTEEQKQKIDQLRNRPRKRPDYSCLMKEIEGGKKLKRVQCNDRSKPLLPESKAKGQFLYESEKSNVHNILLKQIETGVRLKKVKTNDRSRPVLDGEYPHVAHDIRYPARERLSTLMLGLHLKWIICS